MAARDDTDSPRDPESKRSRNSGPSARNAQRERERERATAAAWGAPRRGRSGYGMESIRPYLRAQLEQQKLLRPTFPPEDEDYFDPHLDGTRKGQP
ncbi:hypothetical protein EZ313_13390 [Ramlibacter henchirensis]|uniref:Uncharacterized protein n=1 Tax=Ramlibacter henchirensis TaxID=204072 RepID=A0A4Z0BU43_9BURK|nr:hypothetical protein [Ramlibacter henchirensis]TFZ02262.1 hypothetical protein EZ313_13390 [Ramlibacter henchirensis]